MEGLLKLQQFSHISIFKNRNGHYTSKITCVKCDII